DLPAFRIDVIEENHKAVRAPAASVADRLDEIDLAAAVGGQVLDQQHALAGIELALDLRIAAEAFGLLAHVLHRQMHAVGDPGGERNAGGFTARHRVDLAAADVAVDGGDGEIHHG